MNPAEVDLNLLRVFDAILATRSVTLAGRQLGLSQPAMSNALGRLRKLFGDALFVRTPQGMQPTPLAMELADPVRQALGLIDAALARDRGFEPATSERTFRLHMSDIGEMVFLPPLLERMQAVAPTVRVEVTPFAREEIVEALGSGALDLAVGFLPELGPPVHQRLLFSDPYMALIRSDHPCIGKRMTARQFAEASHALVQSIGSGHDVIERALERSGLARRIALRVPHFTVVPTILARTELVVSIPGMVARMYESAGGFRALALPVPVPPAEVKLHWHERFEQDPANRWLRELLSELLGQPAAAAPARAGLRGARAGR